MAMLMMGVPAIVSEAVEGVPAGNWMTPAPLPVPRFIVLALIVLEPEPRFRIEGPLGLFVPVVDILRVPTVITLIGATLLTVLFASVRVACPTPPFPMLRVPLSETLFRPERSAVATSVLWPMVVVPLTINEPPPMALKALNPALLVPVVRTPLSVRVTPAGILRTLGVGLAVVLLAVLEMLATVGVRTLLLSTRVPVVVVE